MAPCRQSALALIAAAVLVQGCSLSATAPMPAGDSAMSSIILPDRQDAPIVDRQNPKVEPTTKKATANPELKSIGTGKASWYGPGFHGKKTASGDIFDDSKLTAAHKSLPLGSKAIVTNLSNGKSVEVEINDRGPFLQDRLIDVSRAAARALGMVDRGITPVRVELITNQSGVTLSAVE